MPRTILVVPCFNEDQRLLPDVFLAMAKAWPDGAFLLVDDGSTDRTFSILSRLEATMPRSFEVLRLVHNMGKAEAVRVGMRKAFHSDAAYVGFWDADLATPLGTVRLFEDVLRERPAVEMVLGARVRLLGTHIRRNPTRHYLGRGFATVAALVLGIDIYDSQCGAKLFRATEDVQRVFDAPFVSRWIFDVELLARFIRRKRAAGVQNVEELLYELPLPQWHDKKGSKLRPTDFVRAILDLRRIHRLVMRSANLCDRPR
jgi:glycosyltransferase involved in cell wall biosynthesis